MTKDDIISTDPINDCHRWSDFELRAIHRFMDEYAKYHADLAFDAGYKLAAKHETNHPDDALEKKDYLEKHFQS